MRIKRYQFNGMPFVAIIDENDCPACPYASAYLSTQFGRAFNTQLRKANELLFVLDYFGRKKIDLAERVQSGQLISQKEYLQFHTASAGKKQHDEQQPFVDCRPDVSAKSLRNALSANARQLARVSSETHKGRLRRLRQYLETLYQHFHDFFSADPAIVDRCEKLSSLIKLDEDSLGRNRPQGVADPTDSVISDEGFERLREMTLPSSANNPFKGSKIRNYLIVSILAESGIRRGALAKLKISDFQFYGGFDLIKIYRSSIDQTDPRLDKPNQKTKAHFARIPPSLMGQIKHYINHVRSEVPGSDQHDFVFVSEKGSRGTLGMPLSLKSVNGILQSLSEALGFYVHPHLLRHKWNETFDKEGSEQGLEDRLLADARNYAMGWTANTTMGKTYNEKRIAERARAISAAHQKRVDKKR